MRQAHSKPSPAPPTRAERYRAIAMQTQKLAEASQSPQIRANYLSLARCWRNLADQSERLCRELLGEYDETGG